MERQGRESVIERNWKGKREQNKDRERVYALHLMYDGVFLLRLCDLRVRVKNALAERRDHEQVLHASVHVADGAQVLQSHCTGGGPGKGGIEALSRCGLGVLVDREAKQCKRSQFTNNLCMRVTRRTVRGGWHDAKS